MGSQPYFGFTKPWSDAPMATMPHSARSPSEVVVIVFLSYMSIPQGPSV